MPRSHKDLQCLKAFEYTHYNCRESNTVYDACWHTRNVIQLLMVVRWVRWRRYVLALEDLRCQHPETIKKLIKCPACWISRTTNSNSLQHSLFKPIPPPYNDIIKCALHIKQTLHKINPKAKPGNLLERWAHVLHIEAAGWHSDFQIDQACAPC